MSCLMQKICAESMRLLQKDCCNLPVLIVLLRSAIQPCILWACLHHCGTPLTQHLSDPVHACAGAACLVQLSAKLASAQSNQWQSSSSCRCSPARHRHQDRSLSPTSLSLLPRADQQSLAGIYTSVKDRCVSVSHVQEGAGHVHTDLLYAMPAS